MKIALLATGFSRFYQDTFPSWEKHIFDGNEVDIYIVSWDKKEINYNPHLTSIRPSENQLEPINQDRITSFYSKYLTGSKFLNYDEFYTNRFPDIKILSRDNDVMKINEKAKKLGSFWVERLRDQFYLFKLCWESIENKDEYDLFFRLRFDLNIDYMNVYDHNLVIPKSYSNSRYQDFIAYGDQECMSKYFTIFDHMEKLYVDHNIPINYAEQMFQYYLEKYWAIEGLYLDKKCGYHLIRR